MKDQHDRHFLHSGKELTHEEFSNLILSLSTNYDTQFSSSSGQSSRKVYVTEVDDSNFSRTSIYEVTEENVD